MFRYPTKKMEGRSGRVNSVSFKLLGDHVQDIETFFGGRIDLQCDFPARNSHQIDGSERLDRGLLGEKPVQGGLTGQLDGGKVRGGDGFFSARLGQVQDRGKPDNQNGRCEQDF